MVKGRPVGSKAEVSRELTKRQRWTVEEWAEVEKATATANETPSDFMQLDKCKTTATEVVFHFLTGDVFTTKGVLDTYIALHGEPKTTYTLAA